jgi:hypothetical protein
MTSWPPFLFSIQSPTSPIPRSEPRDNGSDLIGRAFLEPELGVCLITGLGPVMSCTTKCRRELVVGATVPPVSLSLVREHISCSCKNKRRWGRKIIPLSLKSFIESRLVLYCSLRLNQSPSTRPMHPTLPPPTSPSRSNTYRTPPLLSPHHTIHLRCSYHHRLIRPSNHYKSGPTATQRWCSEICAETNGVF